MPPLNYRLKGDDEQMTTGKLNKYEVEMEMALGPDIWTVEERVTVRVTVEAEDYTGAWMKASRRMEKEVPHAISFTLKGIKPVQPIKVATKGGGHTIWVPPVMTDMDTPEAGE